MRNFKFQISNYKWAAALLMAVLAGGLMMSVAAAQGGGVTDDQVNAVAKKLNCPVCENVPLDACSGVT